MIAFLLHILFPPFDPLVLPCPSLAIGCAYPDFSHTLLHPTFFLGIITSPIANSQTYPVRFDHALICSSCLSCAYFVLAY